MEEGACFSTRPEVVIWKRRSGWEGRERVAGGGGDEEEDEEPRGTNKPGHSGRTGWTGRWELGEATGVQARSRAQASGGSERGPGCSQPEDSETRENGAWRGLGTGNRTVDEWMSG